MRARAQGDRQRRDRRAELGAHHASAPASTSIRRSPISSTEERLAIADVGIHMLDLARFFMGEVVAHLLRDAAPQPEAARPRTPRPCCCGTRAARVSVVECTYEARRSPDPFPETLVEIEGPRGSIIVDTRLPHDGDQRRQDQRDRHRRAAAVLDQPSLACQPGRGARRLPAFPRLPAARRRRRDVGRGQSQDLRAGRCRLPRGGRASRDRAGDVGADGANVPSKSRRAR